MSILNVAKGTSLSTITAALAKANAGDRIVTHAGDYAERLFSPDMRFPNGVVIEAAKGEAVRLSGFVGIYGLVGVTWRGIEINAQGYDSGLVVVGGQDFVLENTYIHHPLGDCVTTGNNWGPNVNCVIRGSQFSHSGQAGEAGYAKHGVYLSRNVEGPPDSWLIEGCDFWAHYGDFNTWAFHAYAYMKIGKIRFIRNRVWDSNAGVLLTACDDGEVVNNLVYKNKSSGITLQMFGASGRNCKALHNTIVNNGTDAMVSGGDRAQFVNNFVSGNGTNTITGDGTNVVDRNNVIVPSAANAKFYSIPNGDFRPQAGSPAIGKGVVLAEVPTDIEGKPFGIPPTVGAYEYGDVSVIVDPPVIVVPPVVIPPPVPPEKKTAKFNCPKCGLLLTIQKASKTGRFLCPKCKQPLSAV